MIRIDDVHVTLGGRPVLCGVDLAVGKGEVVALVGPSGTGKSVLLRLIVGLAMPDAGDVLVDGESVVRADFRTLSRIRDRIGLVFQDGALLDSLTVRHNLRLALDDGVCRRNPMYEADRIDWAIRLVNLPGAVLDLLPEQLSGGMRKRVAVARAVIKTPDILLYDEPTTGLDPRNVTAIDELIVRSRDALGATGLVVTHDMSSLPIIADRVVLLESGSIRFNGTPREFLESTDGDVTRFLRGGSTTPFTRLLIPEVLSC